MVIQQRSFIPKKGTSVLIYRSLSLQHVTEPFKMRTFLSTIFIYTFLHTILLILLNAIYDFSFTWFIPVLIDNIFFYPYIIILCLACALLLKCIIGVDTNFRLILLYFTISQVYSPLYSSFVAFCSPGTFGTGFVICVPMIIANYLLIMNLTEYLKIKKMETFYSYLVVFIVNMAYVLGILSYFWALLPKIYSK